MRFSRWLHNPLGWLLALLIGVAAVPLFRFSVWRADRWHQLDRGSQLVETRLGKIEFAEAGQGAPVLVIHGAPGGYDQAMAIAAPLLEAGFAVTAPSRPGYLRTPLASGLLVSQQAELLAGLMTQLGHGKYAILAQGEGAPVALALAAAYPDRVSRIVLLAPVLRSRSWPEILEQNRLPGWAINQAFTGDMGAWLYAEQARWQPAKALERAFALTTTLKPFAQFTEADEAMRDAAQRDRFRALVNGVTPVSRREVGIRNDTVLSLAYPAIDYAKLTSPLLVVRGGADVFTGENEVRPLLDQVRSARLLAPANTGYLVELGPKSAETLKQVVEFLRATP